MDPARPLRDVFADLVSDESARQAHAADPEGFLAANGHPELPGSLVSEAIVNYADTAPAEVAEHLAAFVMANGPVPVDDAALPGEMDAPQGLDLLASAPAEVGLEDPAVDPHSAAELAGPDAGAAPDDTADDDTADDDAADDDTADDDAADDAADPFGLDFGHGDTANFVHSGHPGAGEADTGVLDLDLPHPGAGDAELAAQPDGDAGDGDWLAGADLLDGTDPADLADGADDTDGEPDEDVADL